MRKVFDFLKMVLTSAPAMRFYRVYIAALVVLLPALPQDYHDIHPYLIKVELAAIIALLTALDKLIRG